MGGRRKKNTKPNFDLDLAPVKLRRTRIPLKKLTYLVFTACLAFSFSGEFSMVTANAQESTDQTEPEKDPRVVEAETRAEIAEANQREAEANQAIAEASQGVAEARQAERLAKLPDTETTGVDGGVTLEEGSGYFAEVLAYESLDRAAEDIAEKIATKIDTKNSDNKNKNNNGQGQQTTPKKSVIIVDTLDFSTQAALHTFINAEFSRTIGRMNDIKDNSLIISYTIDSDDNAFTSDKEGLTALTALSALPSILGAGRDIAKFFQTELTTTKRTVTLQDNALTAGLVSSLLSKDFEIVLPKASVNPLGSFSGTYGQMQNLRNELAQMKLVAESRAEARKTIFQSDKIMADAELKRLRDELTSLEKEKSPTKAQTDRIKALKDPGGEIPAAELQVSGVVNDLASLERQKSIILGVLTAAIKEADDLTTYLTTANSEGVTPFQAVAVIDAIRANSTHHLLFADIVSQGGEIQTKKTAFSGSINYIGGVVVSFILMDQAGSPIAADNSIKVNAQRVKRSKPIEGLAR